MDDTNVGAFILFLIISGLGTLVLFFYLGLYFGKQDGRKTMINTLVKKGTYVHWTNPTTGERFIVTKDGQDNKILTPYCAIPLKG